MRAQVRSKREREKMRRTRAVAVCARARRWASSAAFAAGSSEAWVVDGHISVWRRAGGCLGLRKRLSRVGARSLHAKRSVGGALAKVGLQARKQGRRHAVEKNSPAGLRPQ